MSRLVRFTALYLAVCLAVALALAKASPAQVWTELGTYGTWDQPNRRVRCDGDPATGDVYFAPEDTTDSSGDNFIALRADGSIEAYTSPYNAGGGGKHQQVRNVKVRNGSLVSFAGRGGASKEDTLGFCTLPCTGSSTWTYVDAWTGTQRYYVGEYDEAGDMYSSGDGDWQFVTASVGGTSYQSVVLQGDFTTVEDTTAMSNAGTTGAGQNGESLRINDNFVYMSYRANGGKLVGIIWDPSSGTFTAEGSFVTTNLSSANEHYICAASDGDTGFVIAHDSVDSAFRADDTAGNADLEAEITNEVFLVCGDYGGTHLFVAADGDVYTNTVTTALPTVDAGLAWTGTGTLDGGCYYDGNLYLMTTDGEVWQFGDAVETSDSTIPNVTTSPTTLPTTWSSTEGSTG